LEQLQRQSGYLGLFRQAKGLEQELGDQVPLPESIEAAQCLQVSQKILNIEQFEGTGTASGFVYIQSLEFSGNLCGTTVNQAELG